MSFNGSPTGPASATPPLIPNPLDMVYVLEPALWAGVISTYFFGIITLQAWTYANNNKDAWYLRLLVAFLIVVDLAIVIISWYSLRFELIQNYGRPQAIALIPASDAFHGLLAGLVTFGVQCFFASRIFLLNRKNFIFPSIVVATGLGGLICGLLTTIHGLQRGQIAMLSDKQMQMEFTAFAILNTISDITATVALTLYLGNSQGSKSTMAAVSKILRDSVTRGFVVTAAQIINLIVYLTHIHSLNWIVNWWTLAEIYVITMLAILNSRGEIKATLHGSGVAQMGSMNMSTFRTTNPQTSVTIGHGHDSEHGHSFVDVKKGGSYQVGSWNQPQKQQHPYGV